MQVQGELNTSVSGGRLNPLQMGLKIIRDEPLGVRGLFGGLSASMARQFVYSGTRFGTYDLLKKKLGETKDNPLELYVRVPVAMASGAFGALVSNPTDMAMVRMQADGRLPLAERRNYKNVFEAIYRTSQEEGILSMWRGCNASAVRALMTTIGHLAAYDTVKGFLISNTTYFDDSFKTHFVSSLGSAAVASILSNPMDVVKTRILNTPPGYYKGSLDCIYKTMVSEGPLAFYKGLVPTFIRQCPFVVVTWVTVEQVKKVLDIYNNRQSDVLFKNERGSTLLNNNLKSI